MSRAAGGTDGGRKPDADLEAVLGELLEPWMDVLSIGLSPELLSAGPAPPRITTLRAGAPPSPGPWDVVLLRVGDRGTPPPEGRLLERAARDLRHGGLLVLVALEGGQEQAASLRQLLEAQGFEAWVSLPASRGLIVSGRRQVPGARDLVGLRRSLHALEDQVAHLEGLLEGMPEKPAGRRPASGAWSLKELVGHLGDLDRDRYGPLIHGALGADPGREPAADMATLVARRRHQQRPLAELVTRLRHVRTQVLELLEGAGEGELLRQGRDAAGDPVTAAALVRSWLRDSEQVLETIQERCAARRSGGSGGT